MKEEKTIDDAKTKEFIASLKLLCVDDRQTTQLLYKSFLEELVQKIHFAEDGVRALEIYEANEIDIIFTDYKMPNMDGLEFLEKIREKNQEIPIIFVSAIEDVDIIVQALNANVNNFIKKPLTNKKIIDSLVRVSKLLIANRYLKKEREYTVYQEDLAFAKELNILRNDFYYQMIGDKDISLVDFLYNPLDVISGDAYTARRIDEHRTLYLIVDGMGKGLSASLSAMIMTSFVNHLVDKMKEYDSFSLDILVKESMEYIQIILLEEEALAIDYILFDSYFNMLSFAKFAMPAILLESRDGSVVKIKSNNPPLSKWQTNYKIDEYDVKDFDKFLFYSDGIVENGTKYEGKTYADFIEDDFHNSFTREELKGRIFEKISEQEDDLTMVFINKLILNDSTISKREFDTRLASLDTANEWYESLWQDLTEDIGIITRANIVFTELFMNAYEHGNLGIDATQKHKLLNDDTYFDVLQDKEQECDKKIEVRVDKIVHLNTNYVITQISDEGKGFDTQILSKIFRNSKKFNGRGVFVSRKNSLGIYYNSKGNRVLFLNKI